MYSNQLNFNPFSHNVAIIKNYFKRPAVMAIAVIYCIGLGISLVSAYFMATAMPALMASSLQSAQVGTYQVHGMELFTSPVFSLLYTIISMLPGLLLCGFTIGAYFTIYHKSKDADISANPVGGFSVLFVVAIIQFVMQIGTSLVLITVLALSILFVIVPVGASTGDMNGMIFTMVFLIVFFAFAIALILTHSISYVRYINSVRNSLNSITLSSKGAGAFGVCSIIYACFVGASLLFTTAMIVLLNFSPTPVAGLDILMTPMVIVSLISSALSVVSMTIDAVIARGYKKYIDNTIEGFIDFDEDGNIIPQ